MANPYFRFKQFTIYHDKCAMKVGTDGVLLGAWTSIKDIQQILDVGCGSGLISLMLAQRADKNVDVLAIDIDEGAVEQTKINIASSSFTNIECRLVSFTELTDQNKFDLIVSNPPFFKDSLHSPNSERTKARHSESLEMEDVFRKSASLLSVEGRLSLIYPFEFKGALFEMAEKYSFKVSRITYVKPTPASNPKRILFECVKTQTEVICEESELIIETSRHVYSQEFTELVKEFYLKL